MKVLWALTSLFFFGMAFFAGRYDAPIRRTLAALAVGLLWPLLVPIAAGAAIMRPALDKAMQEGAE